MESAPDLGELELSRNQFAEFKESTLKVKATRPYPRFQAYVADVPAVGHAGGVLSVETIRAAGLDRALLAVLSS